MDDKDLYVIGAEFPDLKYDGFWDWFVHVSDWKIFLQYHPSYLVSQFAFTIGGLATLFHALTKGGRLPYLWLATIVHGLVIESLSYFVPLVDNFWQSQTPVMFLGRRLPLHIILLYACFIYQSSVGVAKARLPAWAEPFAVGLGSVLIDIPYDIMSIQFMHWTWHDTDPDIYDRHYWVPWNSYYFHSTFAASFTFWFHFTHKIFCKSEGKWLPDKRIGRELLCAVLAGLLGTPGGILMFIPLYHPLHHRFGIHSEVTFFILFAVFLLIIWTGDRIARKDSSNQSIGFKTHWTTWILLGHLLVHYTSFWIMPVFFDPKNEIAIGLKERIGPCDEYIPIPTAGGKVVHRRKYLCATDYDEKYFDWSCLPNGKPPSNGSYWYTACGVALSNRVEFIAIESILYLIGAVVYLNLHLNSFGDEVFELETTQGKKLKKQ